jgi:hypothetical protein
MRAVSHIRHMTTNRSVYGHRQADGLGDVVHPLVVGDQHIERVVEDLRAGDVDSVERTDPVGQARGGVADVFRNKNLGEPGDEVGHDARVVADLIKRTDRLNESERFYHGSVGTREPRGSRANAPV